MSSRSQAAIVQLAAFVVGGILGPVCHIARHRLDHTHGPDGAALALPVDLDDHRSAEPDGHPHPHHHDDQPAELEHDHDAEDDIDQESAADRDCGVRPTLPLDHGHSSISHFGLALIGTAPPLPLPRPARREVREIPAGTAHARLFHPSFPLPRPPPADLRSS